MLTQPVISGKEDFFRLQLWAQNVGYAKHYLDLADRAALAALHGNLREAMISTEIKRRGYVNEFVGPTQSRASTLERAEELFPYQFPTETEGMDISRALASLALVAMGTVLSSAHGKEGVVAGTTPAYDKGPDKKLKRNTLFSRVSAAAFSNPTEYDRFIHVCHQVTKARDKQLAHTDAEVAFPNWTDQEDPQWAKGYDSAVSEVDLTALRELLPRFHNEIRNQQRQLKKAKSEQRVPKC